jgi:hypothetical protein
MSDRFGAASRRAACALAGLSLLLASACRSEEERARSLEALAMSSAIFDLRAAPHDEKRAELDRLQKLTCKNPRACEAQQVCAQAYGLHQKALHTSSGLRREVGEGNGRSAEAAAELLALAEQDLEHARRMMQECLRLETTMLVEARP